MTASTTADRVSLLVELLSRELPADRLVIDREVLTAISRDQAAWAPGGRSPSSPPAA